MKSRQIVTSFTVLLGGLAELALLGTAATTPSTAAVPTATANWAHWRGPTGQGYSDDTRVPLVWSEKQNLVWKIPLPGKGNSSPIVWGERIFLTASSPDGAERSVLCVRSEDGKILWQMQASSGVDPGKTHPWNGFASASCTTDGKYVYAFFGTPGLFCCDFDGKPIWKHQFGIFTSETGWGQGASPFLYEDLVIQNCDNDGPAALPPGNKPEDAAPMSLIALDKATGQIRWQAKRDQGRGFSTPVLLRNSTGRDELLLNGPHGVWAYNPRTGEELWHCERHKGEENALFGEPLPVFNGDTMFAASGRPGPLQAIRMGGAGDITRSHLSWEVSRKASRDVSSPILWGEELYLADRYGVITEYEAKTGKRLYQQKFGSKPFVASPVAVNGKLLFTVETGTTLVLKPGPHFKVVGKNDLDDGTEFRASPAIVAGKLFLRSQAHLYCIGEGK